MHDGQLKCEKSAANFGLCTSVLICTVLLVSWTNCISSDLFLCFIILAAPSLPLASSFEHQREKRPQLLVT